MERRALGATGLSVSVLGLGTWQLAGPLTLDGRPDGYPDPGERAAVDLIRAAAELGIDLIDTAPIYGDGEGERRVGRAIRADRERWVLCTKFGMARGGAGERVVDTRPQAIRPSLEASLRRLATDRVEILLFHAAPLEKHIDEAREVLEALRADGKIRCFGISTGDAALAHRLTEAGCAQVLLAPQSLHTHPDALLTLAREQGLGMIVRGAFERGRLVDPRTDYAEDDCRSATTSAVPLRTYARIRPGALEPSTFALRYLLDLPTTGSILLGARRPAQLHEAARALEAAPLGSELHAAVARARRRLIEGGPMRRALRSVRQSLASRE